MSEAKETKPRVLLLMGGQSSEHPVSCVTAAGVMHAIDAEQFEVIPVGITRKVPGHSSKRIRATGR